MLKVITFLGLIIGMVGCRAPERVAEVGPMAKRPGGLLGPVFVREHRGESAFEPKTRSALSADDGSILAARLANDHCERQYRRRPFKPQQYPIVLSEGVYRWGNLDVGGHEGFSASVMFNPDGSEPHVEVYFSSDALLGVK